MRPYEVSPNHDHHSPRRAHGPAPGAHPHPGGPAERSATPIYDSLYAEYQRLFRALPGDRSGEEELRFEAFTERRTDHHGWGDHQRPHAVQYGGHTRRALPAALPPAPRDGNRYDR